MPVQEAIPYSEAVGNGVSKSFALGFPCEKKEYLIVKVGDVQTSEWSLSNNTVTFTTAPETNVLIQFERSTKAIRTTDYATYNDSLRGEVLNKDFDKVWWKIQELGVADWLLGLKIQKFRDDVKLTALENTLEEAKQIRDETADSVTEVQSNVEQSTILLADTTAQADLAQGYADNASVANTAAQQAASDVSDAESNVYSALNAQTTNVNTALSNLSTTANKYYSTKAAAEADIANIALNQSVTIGEEANSGLWYKATAEATTLTKSPYDPLTQAKNYADTAVINSNEYNYSTTDIFNIAYNRIAGAAANTNLNESTILAEGVGREYIKIDVAEFKSLSISNAIVQSLWVWVFVDKNNVKTVSSFSGNGTLVIPETAVSAYRTMRVDSAGINENANMLISAETKKMPLQAQIITLNNKLVSDFDELQASLEDIQTGEAGGLIPIEPITGGSVVTESSNPNLLAVSSQRKYLKLNVEKYSQLVISGARTNIPEWVWVFTDENLNRLAISSFFGNGELAVPENAAWALRTYEVGGVAIYELETLQISATKKSKSIAVIYDELKNDVSRLEQSSSSNSGFYGLKATMMQEAFQRGEMLKISDFNEANQHDQIESAILFIKKRGWGILDMESGVWLRNSAVLLPDNCWIYLNEATVKLADGVFDNVFRNEGIVPNPDPFEYALELNENRNIRIFGKSKDLAKVSGPDIPYTAPHPINGGDPVAWVGDWYGWRTLPVLLANVKDYKLHDFGMVKTTCWAISQEHGCENFEVFNIGFNTSVKNGDGVDVRQGCKKGKIYNITGFTGDDMVALSAIQNFIGQHPSGNYIYPMQVGGYGDRGFGGNIEDIQINNIKGRGNHNGVRLLASGGSKLKNISVDDVTDVVGAFHGSMVLVSSGYGSAAAMGDMTNITVNGIESNFSQTPLNVSGPIKDSSFNKIRQHKSTGVLYTNTATFENTEITNAEFVV